MNYIYGTWSVLCALNAVKFDLRSEPVQKAVAWLKKIQNSDGGWGEGGESYELDYAGYRPAPSTLVADGMGFAWPDGRRHSG